ncbi:hypothetical protein K445DRAFT_304905 [Daldinia sp. EC12]|nr:hypothetical protein K445DRAFT_304905 [Daldinia sp. EC12]
MADPSSSTPFPYTGVIKVYSAEDDSQVDWTNPRHIHLHKKTSSGVTVCCHPFTAGGIVQSPIDTVHFLTSDRFVPADVEPHMDTNDKTCACVGYVRCTDRRLHYALIPISDAVADSRVIKQAKRHHMISISMRRMYDVVMDPIMIRDVHRQKGLALLARTRYNKVIKGHVTVLPRKAIDPLHHPGTRLILAQFDPSLGCRDVGMWVYTKQPDARTLNGTAEEKSAESDKKPGYPEVSASRHNVSSPNQHHVPLLLVGHIVEIHGHDQDGRVEVAIQCSHEVLTKISTIRDRLNNPCSRCPPLACA